jgi:hypothetical protein
MSVEERLAFVEVEFKKFRIKTPQLVAAQVRLDAMRLAIRKTKGKEQDPLVFLGPTQSGKSTVIKDWIESILANEDFGDKPHPVLHVTLNSSTTQKSLGLDMLTTLGEFAPPIKVIEDTMRRRGPVRMRRMESKGSDAWLLTLALHAVGLAGVEVLVLDEMHHLVKSDTAEVTRYSVTEAVKTICIRGVCQVVCVGTERLQRILSADNTKQLSFRAREPIVLRPVDVSIPEQAVLFKQWVGALDAKLVEHGIFPRASNLASAEWLPCFYDVSRGVLGRVSRIVSAATDFAIINGRDYLTAEDFSQATRGWMVLKKADWDPWAQGARDLVVIRKAAIQEFPV